MQRVEIKKLYRETKDYAGKEITVAGWIRNIRDSKVFGFIELNDGSFFKGVQVVVEADKLENFESVIKLNIGSSIIVKGILVETPEAKQPFEVKATEVEISGTINGYWVSDEDEKLLIDSEVYEKYTDMIEEIKGSRLYVTFVD